MRRQGEGTAARGDARRSQAKQGGRASVVAALVIVAAVAGLVLAWRLGTAATTGDGAGLARVTDGDGTVHELPLDEDAELTVTTSLGTNVIEVRDARVRVRAADCPNQDCVNQGWIDASGEQIVCLPHRLYVEVEGARTADVDVTGR